MAAKHYKDRKVGGGRENEREGWRRGEQDSAHGVGAGRAKIKFVFTGRQKSLASFTRKEERSLT